MINLTENNKRLEFLRQARILVNEEYLKKRNEDMAKWQKDCEVMWISKGILLPYPSSMQYPAEEQVVAKALLLFQEDDAKNVKAPVVDQIIEPIQIPAVSAPILYPPLPEPVVEPEPEVIPEPVVEQTKEEKEEEARQTSYLRSLLAQFVTMAKELDSKAEKDEGTPV
jgi:hypothetical protein